MKNFLVSASVAAAVTFGFAAQASASMLSTDASTYTGPKVDLSAYANGQYNFTNGPVSLPGGLTFTAAPGIGGYGGPNGNSGEGSVIGQGSYGLGANGSFGGTATYIGVDSNTGFDTLSFAAPVSSFGAFFNYAPNNGGNDATITALDSAGNVIASYDLETLAPISTPGGFNQFEFRGIVDTTADIKSFEFGGDYLLLAGSPTGAVVTGGVPEPATWALMIAGVAGVGLALRRRPALQTA